MRSVQYSTCPPWCTHIINVEAVRCAPPELALLLFDPTGVGCLSQMV